MSFLGTDSKCPTLHCLEHQTQTPAIGESVAEAAQGPFHDCTSLHRPQEIEADPSRATREKWRRLEALEDEAREMKLELHLSEQLQTLFTPLDPSAASPQASKVQSQQPKPQGPLTDHFPPPSPTSASVSPSKASSSTPPRESLASLTTKTEDSLTYSCYQPSDTLTATSPSASTYLDTLHGEKIPSESPLRTTTEGKEEPGDGEEEEYQDDEFESEEALYGDEEFESL